mmetsp:Transcript_14598/g.63237  ORF Transcript_14598/g.63237 Transcript_14598/m.63237 type:complete len:262 (+) Transcript_14598:1116-1901(+)
MVHLRAHAHRFSKRRRSDRKDHEFLHSELVAGVRPSIDYIERGNRKNEFGVSSKLRDMLVEGDVLLCSSCLGDRHGHRKNRISTKFALVFRAIELNHEVIDHLLVSGILTEECWCDDSVYIFNSLRHPFTHPLRHITVPEFNGLMNAGRGSRRCHGTKHPLVGVHIGFNSWIPTRVKNLTCNNFSYRSGRLLLQVLGHERDRFGRFRLHGCVDDILDLLAETVLLDIFLNGHIVFSVGTEWPVTRVLRLSFGKVVLSRGSE